MTPRPPPSPLFPYTTLFRSLPRRLDGGIRHRERKPAALAQRLEDQEIPERRGHPRSEEHTSELQSPDHLVCRLLLEKKKQRITHGPIKHSNTTKWTSLSYLA